MNSQRKRARWNPHHPTPSYTSRLPLPSTFTSPHSHDSSSRGTVHHERATIHCSVTHSLRFKTDVNHESGELSLAQALLNNQGHGGYAGIRVQEAENPGLALQVGVFLPLWGTANPQKLESMFSVFFAALNFTVIGNVMGHANVYTDCRLISCYASLCRASGERTLAADVCQTASRMRRICGDAAAHQSTHNTQDHTYTPKSTTSTPTEQHTTKPSTRQPQHGGGRRRRCAWRLCPG